MLSTQLNQNINREKIALSENKNNISSDSYLTGREVTKVIRAQATSDGAGVRLKRSLGTAALSELDPFLMLDEFKSDQASDYIAGFPDHPHRGFETVTYMLAGSMEHKDSKGNTGNLIAGSVQWMTAARGIVHSEMPKQENGLMWGFQLWVNLPAKNKMDDPHYQDIPPSDIPEVVLESGVKIRVITGESNGVQGAVKGIATAPLYLDVSLPANREFTQTIPKTHNAFVYVFEGEGEFGQTAGQAGQLLTSGHLGVLGDGDRVSITTTTSPVRFLLLAGKPLNEPVVKYGPFVMNTQEEIHQAITDYQNGTFLD